MSASPIRKMRMLVTAKTYPRPSQKFEELVCTAGIDLESGAFARLHPVRFRDLRQGAYAKFNVIELDVFHREQDKRGDTWTPADHDAITVVEELPPNAKSWAKRDAHVLPLATTMRDLQARERARACSLGVVRVVGPIRHYAVACSGEWSDAQMSAMQTQRLFDQSDKRDLQKIPWEFRCKFKCEDDGCSGHDMLILDWEPYAQYLKVGLWKKHLTAEGARDLVLDHYSTKLNTDTRDVHMFVGTHMGHRHSFMVIGIYPTPYQR